MFLTNEQYEHVINLMENRALKSPLLSDLDNWAQTTLGVIVFDYICDTLHDGQPRLLPVLWSDTQYRKMKDNTSNYDKEKQRNFREKFAELSRKYQIHPEYHNPDNFFVAYETIKDEIEKRILKAGTHDLALLKGEHIWEIRIINGTIHIFYETDAQVKEFAQNGISDDIQQKCKEVLRKYDSYQFYSKRIPCHFTSRETFVRIYKENWFYYISDN